MRWLPFPFLWSLEFRSPREPRSRRRTWRLDGWPGEIRAILSNPQRSTVEVPCLESRNSLETGSILPRVLAEPLASTKIPPLSFLESKPRRRQEVGRLLLAPVGSTWFSGKLDTSDGELQLRPVQYSGGSIPFDARLCAAAYTSMQTTTRPARGPPEHLGPSPVLDAVSRPERTGTPSGSTMDHASQRRGGDRPGGGDPPGGRTVNGEAWPACFERIPARLWSRMPAWTA